MSIKLVRSVRWCRFLQTRKQPPKATKKNTIYPPAPHNAHLGGSCEPKPSMALACPAHAPRFSAVLLTHTRKINGPNILRFHQQYTHSHIARVLLKRGGTANSCATRRQDVPNCAPMHQNAAESAIMRNNVLAASGPMFSQRARACACARPAVRSGQTLAPPLAPCA